jgi:hypothetical protein
VNRPTDSDVLVALTVLRAWLAPDPAPHPDEWITLRPREPVLGLGGIRGRCVIDAGKRGELTIARLGGRPAVRRSELTRWAESRRVAPRARAERSGDADDSYELIVAGSRQ